MTSKSASKGRARLAGMRDKAYAYAESLLVQGVAAAQAGRLSEAAQHWWQLIGTEPGPKLLTQAWFNLALLCRKSGDLAASERCLQAALAATPDNREAREQLAQLLAESGRVDAAIEQFRQLAADVPDPRHYFNSALLLAQSGRSAEAEAEYRAGLLVQPDHADILRNLGLLLSETGASAEAIACLKRATQSAPESAAMFSNLGAVLEADSQLQDAAVCLQRAVALAPQTAVTHCDLGVLYVELGRFDEAEACFLQAETVDPNYRRALFCRAQLLLATGRYAEGWRLHEQRFACGEEIGKPALPKVAIPAWQGESLQGKHVLLRQEQGYGDEIQFSRYYRELKRLGARRVDLICKPALVDVLSTVEGVDTIVGSEPSDTIIAGADYWVSAMSLPHWCQLPEPQARLPYLHVPVEAARRWQGRLVDTGRLRVGLLWQGNPGHSNDKHRSLPGVETLAPLWQVAGVEFYSLHRQVVVTALPIHQPGPDIQDFADAAAVIEQLDLLITVDSAYAHLAGALGKAVWIMLPARNTDWRWLYGREDTPWYPGVMRLFRQRKRQDWSSVVESIQAALLQRLA